MRRQCKSFGKGGPNAYAYCLNDPINNIDPDDHWTLNPAKIARHLYRTHKGTQYKYFENKYTEHLNKANSSINRIHKEVDLFENQPDLPYSPRYSKPEHEATVYSIKAINNTEITKVKQHALKLDKYYEKAKQHGDFPMLDEQHKTNINILDAQLNHIKIRTSPYIRAAESFNRFLSTKITRDKPSKKESWFKILTGSLE